MDVHLVEATEATRSHQEPPGATRSHQEPPGASSSQDQKKMPPKKIALHTQAKGSERGQPLKRCKLSLLAKNVWRNTQPVQHKRKAAESWACESCEGKHKLGHLRIGPESRSVQSSIAIIKVFDDCKASGEQYTSAKLTSRKITSKPTSDPEITDLRAVWSWKLTSKKCFSCIFWSYSSYCLTCKWKWVNIRALSDVLSSSEMETVAGRTKNSMKKRPAGSARQKASDWSGAHPKYWEIWEQNEKRLAGDTDIASGGAARNQPPMSLDK